jgi:hypothetical protein
MNLFDSLVLLSRFKKTLIGKFYENTENSHFPPLLTILGGIKSSISISLLYLMIYSETEVIYAIDSTLDTIFM